MWIILLVPLAVISATGAAAQQNRDLDREFQAAVAQYDSGQYTEAAARLENLVREAPESFEVHELLGLVYSAQSHHPKPNHHLIKTTHPNPHSLPPRTTPSS